MSSLLFLDFETTGLGDKAAPIEIALHPIIDGEVKDPYHSYIQPHPGAFIDPEAFRINGIDPKLLPTFPTPETVVKEVVEYLDQFETVFSLAGHNIIKFDVPHLYRLFCRTANYGNYLVRFDTNHVDTYVMAKEIFRNKRNKPEKFNLGALCNYFEIELSNAHTATADTIANIQLYEKLSALMPKLIKPANNMTYHQKRTKYMSASYLTVNPEGDCYINSLATKDSDAMTFILGELWRLFVKD